MWLDLGLSTSLGLHRLDEIQQEIPHREGSHREKIYSENTTGAQSILHSQCSHAAALGGAL